MSGHGYAFSGSGVAYSGVDIQAGEIGDWNYFGAAGGHEGRVDDCPMPWWTWTAEAVAAWCKNIKHRHRMTLEYIHHGSTFVCGVQPARCIVRTA